MKRARTTTFLLELPLVVSAQQAKHLRAHLETARCFYNAVLGEARTRLRRMQADPAWDAARALPRLHKHARKAAFASLREQYGFTEYALHAVRQTGSLHLDCRSHRFHHGSSAGQSRVSCGQSGLPGQGANSALQEPWTRAGQCGRQTQ